MFSWLFLPLVVSKIIKFHFVNAFGFNTMKSFNFGPDFNRLFDMIQCYCSIHINSTRFKQFLFFDTASDKKLRVYHFKIENFSTKLSVLIQDLFKHFNFSKNYFPTNIENIKNFNSLI